MATALTDAQTPDQESASNYAKRDNVTVPGADQADAALTVTETRAASRETDRGVHNSNQGTGHTPDAADYEATGSERG